MFSAIKTVVLLITAGLIVSSCEQDVPPKKKDFKAKIRTFYRVSPTAPQPVVVNGTAYVGFAYFPGGGTGNATHLGNCTNYYNQLAYGTSPDAPPAGSVAAPVVDVLSYPVTGGPLPLIQSGDFTAFGTANNSLHVPASVYNQIINSVLYNNKGDAIFTSALTGTGSTFPVSETVVGFNGKAIIVGGRGKFKHAIGEFNYSGYFSLINPNDAEYNADGWIDY
jgi:hypothetical protein